MQPRSRAIIRSMVLNSLSHKFLDITIVSVECASGIGLRALPVARFAVQIARGRPRQYGSLEALKRRNTAIKTLLRQRREPDLRHVEPRPFARRRVRLNLWAEGERCIRRSHLIKRTRSMRLQVISDQTHTLNLGRGFRQEGWQKCRRIPRGSSRPHFHIAPPWRRLTGQTDTAGAILLLSIMGAARCARPPR
jgi:hypothetical protein